MAGDYVPIKVLHADDSVVIRNTMRRRLEENGIFSVRSVTNGDEAWVDSRGREEKGLRLTGRL